MWVGNNTALGVTLELAYNEVPIGEGGRVYIHKLDVFKILLL